VEVLRTLGETQSLNFKAIQGKLQTDKANLSAAMKFLEEQNLVVLHKASSSILYKNTIRGIRVFKYLTEGTRFSGQVSPGVNFLKA
jgi:hypothetical protein